MESLIVQTAPRKFFRIYKGKLSEKQFELVINNAWAFGAHGFYADLPRKEFGEIWAAEVRDEYLECFDSMPSNILGK